MPEGHSLFRLAKYLDQFFAGQHLRAASPQGRFEAGAGQIDGQFCVGAWSYGKHLFVAFSAEELGDLPEWPATTSVRSLTWLHIHLGIYGSFRFFNGSGFEAIGAPRMFSGMSEDGEATQNLGEQMSSPLRRRHGEDHLGSPLTQAPEPGPNVRLRLWGGEVEGHLSGPAACELLDGPEVEAILGRLGPDPLNTPDDYERFIEVVRRRRTPIGQLVMDQSVCAGPGNIFRAEALFVTGINPYRAGQNISVKRLRALWDELAWMLKDGTTREKIITVPAGAHDEFDVDVYGENVRKYYVYHRTGMPCVRCGSKISEALMQNRRLFWCPGCQR